jgi:autotransporter passenger strand-loop-strand repeat protein
MIINLIADSSVASAPTGFTQAVQAAANILDSLVTNNITLNITYGWGTYDNQTLSELQGGNLAVGGYLNGNYEYYSTAKSWLDASATSALDLTALASLPTDSSAFPNDTNIFVVSSAEEKALGHYAGNPNAVDGGIGFGTATNSSFWLGAALHEITHAMGRISGYSSSVYTDLMDMFRYSGAGTYQWTGGQPAYFSVNGGVTDLANFSTVSDYGDFANDSLTPSDPFDAYLTGSSLTQVDIQVLDALGFNVGTPLTVSAGQTQLVSAVQLTGAIVQSGGTLQVDSGGATVGTTVEAGGYELVSATGVGSGSTVSSGGHQVVFAGGTVSGTDLLSGGQLVISGGSVSNLAFKAGATVDLTGQAYDSAGSTAFNSATDILSITEHGTTYALQLAGNYAGDYFHLANDGNGGTLLTEDTTPCYCRGTRILTDHGEIPVEQLKIGDLLVTHAGEVRPIRWIGMRSYGGPFAMGNRDVLPVCIRESAIADNVPKRDLWVSPQHAMYLGGVLVPARILVNGTSIAQPKRAQPVEYFHLELETHDVIVAEGALSETYLDDGNRAMFFNAATYRELYPAAIDRPAGYCAPRLEDGFEVEAIRRGLALRAAEAASATAA